MKNLINKLKTKTSVLLAAVLFAVTALFAVERKMPTAKDTERIHITTLHASVVDYSHSTFTGIRNGISSFKEFTKNFFATWMEEIATSAFNLLQLFGSKIGALQFIDGLDIQDTTWSGPAASYMITRAVIGADTIEKGCIYVEDGIRKKKTIPRIEVANFIQKRKATPTSKGTVTVDGRVLEPKDLMLYYEFNPRDYEQHFYAEQLTPKLLGRELPVNAENFMMVQTMKRLNEFFENAIHRSRIDFDPDGANVDPTTVGEVAGASDYLYFDGLIKRLIDAASDLTYPTITVGSPVALTSANIRDKFAAALALVPKPLLGKFGKAGLKFCISYADGQKYAEALRTDAFKNTRSDEKAYDQFRGYEIEMLGGLPENTFYLAIQKPDVDSNTWLGINSVDDNMLQLQRLQNNSELFFVKGLFKMDSQIGFPDQFVLYTTLT